jgi:hypothetical protein
MNAPSITKTIQAQAPRYMMEKRLLYDVVAELWTAQEEAGVKRWAVFPCSKNKTPFYPKGHKFGSGHKSATTDLQTAKEMFGELSTEFNHIGIAGGEASGGIFALDIDVKDALIPENMRDIAIIEEVLTSNYGDLPGTVTQKTPSGGLHRIYKGEGIGALNDAFSVAETGLSIDLKGNGGYFTQ